MCQKKKCGLWKLKKKGMHRAEEIKGQRQEKHRNKKGEPIVSLTRGSAFYVSSGYFFEGAGPLRSIFIQFSWLI